MSHWFIRHQLLATAKYWDVEQTGALAMTQQQVERRAWLPMMMISSAVFNKEEEECGWNQAAGWTIGG
eukprot:scaffold290784_cov44-Attheya_sp.AAC.2